MSKKIIVPQKGETLKDLRDRRNLSQLRMAEQLEKVLYDATQVRYSIQQSDVSRLETEKATIDLPKLLAYVLLCKVSASELITAPFNVLLNHPGAMRLHTFTRDQDAERKLLELEQGGRVLISPEFPSSFFRLSPDSSRFKQLDSPDYLSREIYTAEAFLNFLFSPVSRYSLEDKTHILKTCIQYFQQSINHNLFFFSASQLPTFSQLPTLQLLPARRTLLISAPAHNFHSGDAFIEISDPGIYTDAAAFYSKLPTFENSTIYLRIGLETLEKMRAGGLAREAIQFFGREVMRTRDSNALTVIKSFSPEIQQMLHE
ncbi:MAG: helix-turn-helix transcriptional regulator [Thiolinea sp.]